MTDTELVPLGVSIRRAAAILGVDRQTVRRWADRGRLKWLEDGTIDRASLEAVAEERDEAEELMQRAGVDGSVTIGGAEPMNVPEAITAFVKEQREAVRDSHGMLIDLVKSMKGPIESTQQTLMKVNEQLMTRLESAATRELDVHVLLGELLERKEQRQQIAADHESSRENKKEALGLLKQWVPVLAQSALKKGDGQTVEFVRSISPEERQQLASILRLFGEKGVPLLTLLAEIDPDSVKQEEGSEAAE